MTVQYAKETDKTRIEELWRYSFNDNEDFIKYYFNNRYRAENTIVYKDEDLKAALQMNPYRLRIDGETEPVSYIIGISVFPEQRGKGLTTNLLKSSLMEEYKSGHSVSLLMPIDTSLYTRYGYQNCFNMHSYTIALSDIEFTKTDYTIRRLSEDSVEGYRSLAQVYSIKSSEWDIFLEKDEDYFKELYKETKSEAGEIFMVYDAANEPKGYMVFYPKFEPLETGFVRELIALDKDALGCLLNTVKSHFTQIKKVMVYQPESNTLQAYFDYNNKLDIQIKPFMMARVVNVRKVIEKIFTSDKTFDIIRNSLENSKNLKDGIRLFIDIEDLLIEHNNKVFCLKFGRIDQDRSEIDSGFILTEHDKPYKGHIEDEDIMMSMDIGTFSQLYFGIDSVDTFLFKGKITTRNCSNEFSKTLFPIKASYINEYI